MAPMPFNRGTQVMGSFVQLVQGRVGSGQASGQKDKGRKGCLILIDCQALVGEGPVPWDAGWATLDG